MSFDGLQLELWTRIIDVLANPTPRPLSGLTKLEAVGEVARWLMSLCDCLIPIARGLSLVRPYARAILPVS